MYSKGSCTSQTLLSACDDRETTWHSLARGTSSVGPHATVLDISWLDQDLSAQLEVLPVMTMRQQMKEVGGTSGCCSSSQEFRSCPSDLSYDSSATVGNHRTLRTADSRCCKHRKVDCAARTRCILLPVLCALQTASWQHLRFPLQTTEASWISSKKCNKVRDPT